MVNSADLLCQIHIHFSSTCSVILTNTRTVHNGNVCFAKEQIENHHKYNANIIEAVNGRTILLCFNLKDTIIVMATVILVYSDKFSVNICSSRFICAKGCREDTLFLLTSHLEYGLYKGFCILV